MLLKHANQYAPFLVKVFSPTVLADIGSDVLKLVNLMSMTDNALGHHDQRRLMFWKYYWMKIRRRHERDSLNSWELIKQQFQDDCIRWGKVASSENGYHMNSRKTALAAGSTFASRCLPGNARRTFCGKLLLVTKNVLCTTVLNTHTFMGRPRKANKISVKAKHLRQKSPSVNLVGHEGYAIL
uniref:Myb_DNA-bind_3 domain-containing protein n=1 Tax=Heterorhabditis bacteriophora TaxID=37862 RepID=A0A1I7XKA5_HETBA